MGGWGGVGGGGEKREGRQISEKGEERKMGEEGGGESKRLYTRQPT